MSTAYKSDTWTISDELGLDSASNNLAKMCLEVEPPFSIAITGKWGSGKTSIMRRAFATLGGLPLEQALPLTPRLSHKKLTPLSIETKELGVSINFSIVA